MRKVILAAAVAALGSAVLAGPATASFDPHFNVLAKQISGQQTQHGFKFKDKLLDPRNTADKVGRDKGECREKPHALKCRVTIHLNGELGGFGDLRLAGNFSRHRLRLNVVGGSDDFNGVAGKMVLHSINGATDKLHFDLVR
jgi:hypothetical protein